MGVEILLMHPQKESPRPRGALFRVRKFVSSSKGALIEEAP